MGPSVIGDPLSFLRPAVPESHPRPMGHWWTLQSRSRNTWKWNIVKPEDTVAQLLRIKEIRTNIIISSNIQYSSLFNPFHTWWSCYCYYSFSAGIFCTITYCGGGAFEILHGIHGRIIGIMDRSRSDGSPWLPWGNPVLVHTASIFRKEVTWSHHDTRHHQTVCCITASMCVTQKLIVTHIVTQCVSTCP